MALLGKASFNRTGNVVLGAVTVILALGLLIAWQAPGAQGRLTEYPSHPLGWYGWAMALFGVSVMLVLLRTSGGGWLARLLFATVMPGIGLGALLILHISAWRLIDDHRDFGSGAATITEQRLPISWVRHHRPENRRKRSIDHYSASTPQLPHELYLGKQDFDRLRAGRAMVLNTNLPINGGWCFKLRVERGRRGAVRILDKQDGRLPPGSVVPCRAGEDRG